MKEKFNISNNKIISIESISSRLDQIEESISGNKCYFFLNLFLAIGQNKNCIYLWSTMCMFQYAYT
jgi:hypothetical protein